MRPRLAFAAAAGAAAFAALALSAQRADAYDVLAVPCAQNELTCGVGGVSFQKADALPIQWSFDTGWVPQGSPLQVHIWADVWANTYVNLAGSLQSAWPTAMTLDAPGAKEGGAFGFHYGADFGAQGKISVSVLGKTYSWTGDLPYVPQFDLEVKDDKVFDAWAYDPGITISGETMPQKIAQVSIADIVGSSIPGIDGGFELDVAVELGATYVTNQVVVTTTDGQPVAGGVFKSETDQSSTPYTNGPSIELDIHPEGTVNYDGTIHLIPAFYVSLLGSSWQIPVADIPISFPITETDWIFDNQRVHFPLPDLAISQQVLDFGEIEVGEDKSLDYQLWNAGEALAAATMASSDDVVFPLFQSSAAILPGLTTQATVSFTPKKPGDFTGQVIVASNDPNSPMQTILLKGKAKGPPAPPSTTPPEMEEPMAANEEGNCACRAAGDASGGHAGALAMAALGAVLTMRRRRRG